MGQALIQSLNSWPYRHGLGEKVGVFGPAWQKGREDMASNLGPGICTHVT